MLIEDQGEPGRPFGCLSEQFLLFTELAIFLRGDECIGNLLECVLHGLLIIEHRFLILRSRQLELGPERSAFEEGLRHAEGTIPGLGRCANEPIQCVAFQSARPGERDAGKEAALATPICALAAIMLASASRTSGRRSSNSEGRPAGTATGTGSSVNARPRVIGPGFSPNRMLSSIFLLLDLSLEVWNGFRGSIDELL